MFSCCTALHCQSESGLTVHQDFFTTRIKPPPDQLLILASSCLCSCHHVCLIHHSFFPLCLISFLLLKALSLPSGYDEIHFEACALLSLGSCSQACRSSIQTASTMAFSLHLSPSESGFLWTAFVTALSGCCSYQCRPVKTVILHFWLTLQTRSQQDLTQTW